MTDALEIDVRPILNSGGEPFGAIMEAVNRLAPGQSLRLLAPFKPAPLFNVMAGKGFDYEASEIGGGDWQVLFSPTAGPVVYPGQSLPDDPDTWPDPAYYHDCTELEPPEPMVRILSQLESMAEGEVLFALLGREPVFLFPELQARGHAWVGQFDAAGVAYQLMVRAGTKP